MHHRRSFLTAFAVAIAGCAAPGDSDREGAPDGEPGSTDTPEEGSERDTGDTPDDGGERDTGDPSGYHLRASPVGAPDREPVLSSDDDAIARIEALVELLAETADALETTYAPLSPSEAEAFEAATADVERYYAGNPPGYYIDHRGLVISVSRSG
jgi:hypothetical protein